MKSVVSAVAGSSDLEAKRGGRTAAREATSEESWERHRYRIPITSRRASCRCEQGRQRTVCAQAVGESVERRRTECTRLTLPSCSPPDLYLVTSRVAPR